MLFLSLRYVHAVSVRFVSSCCFGRDRNVHTFISDAIESDSKDAFNLV